MIISLSNKNRSASYKETDRYKSNSLLKSFLFKKRFENIIFISFSYYRLRDTTLKVNYYRVI